MRRSLFFFLAVLVFAQAAPEVEITAEPHHHLTLSNDQVRVFNVEVAPHSDTLMHWHRHDYVFVTLGPSYVVNAVKGKDPVTLKLADGDTRFSPATFAHIARNLSDQPFRNVTIELLQDEKLRSPSSKRAASKSDDRGLNILQGGTQEILWVHDGVRASEFELQPGGVAPAHPHAYAQLMIAVSDLDLRSDLPLKSPTPVAMPAHLKSGDSQWLVAGNLPAITNTGHSVARFVTLEFP